MNFLNFFALVLLFLLCISAQDYHVLDYGAKGDGVNDDTQAVRAALRAALNSNGGRVIFDSGYTFLTGGFNLSNNVILDVRGTILGSLNASAYENIPTLSWYGNDTHDGNNYLDGLTKQPIVYSLNVTNITIAGGGIIDGQGPYWYACMNNITQPPCYPYGRPRLIQPTYSSNILIENITIKDSPFWTVHLAYTSNVHINNVSISSPVGVLITRHSGLNTDGVDIDCSVNVTVENSFISVADDAIAVKAGWNYFGRTFGRTSENILVRNLNIGYSNGLAIGSEMSGGARNVTFKDSVLNGSLHAVIIKTEVGRGGTVEDVTYSNITIYNTTIAIELNMNYGQPGDGDYTIPTIKNIIIDTVLANNVDYLYNLVGLPQSPVQNVYFANINATNISKRLQDGCTNITVAPACPPCLQTEACVDALTDCSLYINFCNNQAYHATLCDLCRKTCNLCSSC